MSKSGSEVERDDIDEQESHRQFLDRLSDWFEPGEVRINRDGKLLEPPHVLGKRIFKSPRNRPRR